MNLWFQILITSDLSQMAALVRADSTESIPEADPTLEYDVVPIAAEYILRVRR